MLVSLLKQRFCQYRILLLSAFMLFVSLTGCTSKPITSIEFMPAPEVYAKGTADPFTNFDPESSVTYRGILYATNRKPDETGAQAYLDERGSDLRIGLADLTLEDGEYSWEELRRFTLSAERGDTYSLNIGDIREIGTLARSATVFSPDDMLPDAASREFSSLVNDKLAISPQKDVYIYVHGYNVGFNKPILTSAQLWHFLGSRSRSDDEVPAGRQPVTRRRFSERPSGTISGQVAFVPTDKSVGYSRLSLRDDVSSISESR